MNKKTEYEAVNVFLSDDIEKRKRRFNELMEQYINFNENKSRMIVKEEKCSG